MPLVQLIYVSDATQRLSELELDAILTSSVRHNQEQEITGLLLYLDGSFMQVLEGESEAIDETYSRICKDARHRAIMLLLKEDIAAREFSRWSMGFRRLTVKDAEANPGYANIINTGFDPKLIGSVSGGALEMMKTFYRDYEGVAYV